MHMFLCESIIEPQILEALLVLLVRHLLVLHILIIGVCNYKVDLGALIRHQVSRLFVQELLDLSVLNLIENSLKQLLQLVLTHYRLGHYDEGHLCLLSHLLIGILQVVGQED